MAQLNATGNAKLIEATVGGFWGIIGAIHSKAAKEEIGTGKNRFGHVLMTVRSEYISSPLPSSPQVPGADQTQGQ